MKEHELAKAFEHLNGMVPERAHSSAVILFAARSAERQLVPFGTGSLFAIADRRFIVTAAHVHEDAEKQGFDFLCATTRKGKFTPLHRGVWGVMHKFDVAIFELNSKNAEDLDENVFLSLADVALDVDLTSGLFAIFTVPACWSESSFDDQSGPVKAKALQFVTTPYEGDVGLLADFNPTVHIALGANDEHLRNHDGLKISWPDRLGGFLPGISGCAIWKIADKYRPNARPEPDVARVVGVETGVYSGPGVIKGTRWDAVGSLIQQGYPELRSAFNIVWASSSKL